MGAAISTACLPAGLSVIMIDRDAEALISLSQFYSIVSQQLSELTFGINAKQFSDEGKISRTQQQSHCTPIKPQFGTDSIRRDSNLELILFNDDKIPGVIFWTDLFANNNATTWMRYSLLRIGLLELNVQRDN